ncbi:DUF445 domain-containing protein [Exiguobacterium flavidum]|uniref:DUF445 domain-containing protein n=1 Tax=Exiguobacterium flavidum TaxID=2184695 RepID=UPI000DF817AC|nr:DUF445 family protein [Exiguobacterium flavidum]
MNSFLLVLSMVVIGALIGTVTNHVAIKMLFRPLEAKYIGKYRIPFTPGLIPKRRDDLAANLGRTVVKHLLTPEGIGKRLREESMRESMIIFAQEETRRLMRSEVTVRELLAKVAPLPAEKIRRFVGERLDRELDQFIAGIVRKSAIEVIGEEGTDRIRKAVPRFLETMLEKAEAYFESEEGTAQIQYMADRFIQGKFGGGMFGMLLANINLVEMIRPEIKRVLQGESTKELLGSMIMQELDKTLEQPIERLVDQQTIDRAKCVAKTAIIERMNIEGLLDRPLSAYLSSFETRIVEELVPGAVDILTERLSSKVGDVMKKLDVEKIVREEVSRLDTAYLEEIVLSISRREFRAITWLGGLLGGLIGLIQGAIALLS